MKEIILILFGTEGIGKTTIIERCKPNCPHCIFINNFNNELSKIRDKKNIEIDEFYLKKICQEKTFSETKWKIKKNFNSPSLKWLCRHVIVSNNLKFKEILPEELNDYIYEIKSSYCSQCKTFSIKYLEKTTKCCYFDFNWNKNGIDQVKIIDTIPWYNKYGENNFLISQDLTELLKLLIHVSKGFILVYDVSSRLSFEALTNIIQTINTLKLEEEQKYFLVIGNKIDKNRLISKEEAIEFSKKYNTLYIECCARDSTFLSTPIFSNFLNYIQSSTNNQQNFLSSHCSIL